MSVASERPGIRDATPRHRAEGGFTLIEMLIVIIILGVLAGIAIFSLRPFQTAAASTCFDVELASLSVVEAAQRAGMDLGSDFNLIEDVECVPIILEQTAAVDGANDTESMIQLNSSPAEGRTLVAVSAHRHSSAITNPVICSGDQYLNEQQGGSFTCTSTTAGWQRHGVFNAGTSSGDRRGIAVWTKIAGPDEPTVIRAAWPISGGQYSGSKGLVVGVFNRSVTVTGISTGTGDTPMVNTLALGAAPGNAGPVLVVGGLALRNAGAGPCAGESNCFTWGGVPGLRLAERQPGSVHTLLAWASIRDGAGSHEAIASWTNNQHAVGFTMVLSLIP